MNPYQKLIDRKRKWTPVAMEAGPLKAGSEEVIRRALALRHMELPVGDFILEGLEKGVPEAARTLLEMNVDDERNHDLALGYAALSHGTDEKAEAEAKRIERELENTTLNKFIKNLESRVYATLSKQMVDNMFAECGDGTEVTCSNSGTSELELEHSIKHFQKIMGCATFNKVRVT